jgi:hypothetical protein
LSAWVRCLPTVARSGRRHRFVFADVIDCGKAAAMRRIIEANIARFKELLLTEADPTKQAMETRLLAEEEAKLKELAAKTAGEKRAY